MSTGDSLRTDRGSPGGSSGGVPAPEIVTVRSRRVKCDGGGGALGHPVVFYDMGDETFVECLYCDRRFVLEAGEAGGDDH
ncbi:MAG: zinc-finger domain-containing protein [Hyphomonadaceae bacterium]|nr:zinc-finger domain-containing protein [Hyphomonadaceae bacterium]